MHDGRIHGVQYMRIHAACIMYDGQFILTYKVIVFLRSNWQGNYYYNVLCMARNVLMHNL